jgi:hypothetical protein
MPSHTRARRGRAVEPQSTYAPCYICGIETRYVVCQHHVLAIEDGWSESNRIWCDYFHREKPLPRLPPRDREDYWDALEWHEQRVVFEP